MPLDAISVCFAQLQQDATFVLQIILEKNTTIMVCSCRPSPRSILLTSYDTPTPPNHILLNIHCYLMQNRPLSLFSASYRKTACERSTSFRGTGSCSVLYTYNLQLSDENTTHRDLLGTLSQPTTM